MSFSNWASVILTSGMTPSVDVSNMSIQCIHIFS